MRREIITDNSAERIEAVDTGTGLGLIHTNKIMYPEWRQREVMILNSKEMNKIIKFYMEGKHGNTDAPVG